MPYGQQLFIHSHDLQYLMVYDQPWLVCWLFLQHLMPYWQQPIEIFSLLQYLMPYGQQYYIHSLVLQYFMAYGQCYGQKLFIHSLDLQYLMAYGRSLHFTFNAPCSTLRARYTMPFARCSFPTIAFCLLPIAYCLLPTAYCLPYAPPAVSHMPRYQVPCPSGGVYFVYHKAIKPSLSFLLCQAGVTACQAGSRSRSHQ
jgi:hypothetical protein